jgi:hypothetical protein
MLMHQFLLVFVLFVSSIATLVAFFLLGKCLADVKSCKQQTGIASLAAIHALIASEGLNKSTVIQRIVEKYNVVPEKSSISEETKKLEEELQSMVSPHQFQTKKDRENRLRAEQSLFEAKDLV